MYVSRILAAPHAHDNFEYTKIYFNVKITVLVFIIIIISKTYFQGTEGAAQENPHFSRRRRRRGGGNQESTQLSLAHGARRRIIKVKQLSGGRGENTKKHAEF